TIQPAGNTPLRAPDQSLQLTVLYPPSGIVGGPSYCCGPKRKAIGDPTLRYTRSMSLSISFEGSRCLSACMARITGGRRCLSFHPAPTIRFILIVAGTVTH